MPSLEEDSGTCEEDDSTPLDCWVLLEEYSETCCCDEEDSLELLFSEDEDSLLVAFSEEEDSSGFSILSELDEILVKISSLADVESLQAVKANEITAEVARLAAAFLKWFMIYLL